MLSSRALIRATRASAPQFYLVPKFLPGSSFRAYATPSGTPDSKPPVALYGLDGTYASALVCQEPAMDGDGLSTGAIVLPRFRISAFSMLTNFRQQYTAAVKSSSLDSVAKALNSLNEIYHRDPKLATIMTAPTLSAEDKSAIVAELQKHTGGADKADTVKNFLNTLAENNRLGLLKGVCEKFGELMGAARGEVELTVTSASVCQ